MSKLYVCKEYETPYEEGFKVVSTLEDHNKEIYNKALDDIRDIMTFHQKGLDGYLTITPEELNKLYK